ncbi:hypothetical protein MLD38_008204 [Melastoma candidum]|uniref:Uncharacterized protein n=1 Tax=Melastoma candidum TaxID=119954 RepID=A0ACB9RT62_9MYRT|nr:hypothetical protein MLD38_008204 [Melastoma candidum]
MMRQQNQFPNSGMEGFGGNRMQLTQPMEYGSADYHGQFEAFTPPRDDTHLGSKVEAQLGWDRGGPDPAHSAAGRMMYEGQGIGPSRSYYQGQRQDSRMHLERHGSSDNRPPWNNADMDVEYDKSPFLPTFEALERKFLDDIGKLAKELNDAEDAENTRHREKINAINAQYQEQLMSLRTKHANRRDEFLRRESTARQQQYQKVMIDRYSSSGRSPRNPKNFGGGAVPGSAGPYSMSDRYDSFGDGSRPHGGARGRGDTRGPYQGGRTYDKVSRFN